MRERRDGLIINVGSVAGSVAIPLNGYYAATKHALVGYTEALRHEVAHLGVRVALVEPGDYASKLWAHQPTVPARFADYRSLRDRVLSTVGAMLEAAPPPTPRRRTGRRARTHVIARASLPRRLGPDGSTNEEVDASEDVRVGPTSAVRDRRASLTDRHRGTRGGDTHALSTRPIGRWRGRRSKALRILSRPPGRGSGTLPPESNGFRDRHRLRELRRVQPPRNLALSLLGGTTSALMPRKAGGKSRRFAGHLCPILE